MNILMWSTFSQQRNGIQKSCQLQAFKDPQTGVYKNYAYPDFIDIPFNPGTDEYPYPAGAINMTYDGLHPSDKGYSIIANMLEKKMKHY